MTNRLIIHIGTSTITIESDDIEKLSKISDFCKKDLNAYTPEENYNELKIDSAPCFASEELHSLLFELSIL